jgi:hypothetical protein
VLGQEAGVGRAIREEEGETDGNNKRQEGDDKHVPLPSIDSVRVRGIPGWGEICAIGDESRDDCGKSVTLESPTDTLSHFHTGVKHGAYEHDTGGDASFARSEKETESN